MYGYTQFHTQCSLNIRKLYSECTIFSHSTFLSVSTITTIATASNNNTAQHYCTLPTQQHRQFLFFLKRKKKKKKKKQNTNIEWNIKLFHSHRTSPYHFILTRWLNDIFIYSECVNSFYCICVKRYTHTHTWIT